MFKLLKQVIFLDTVFCICLQFLFDLANQGNAHPRLLAEHLFLFQHAGGGKALSRVGQEHIALGEISEAQQISRLCQREQIVCFHVQIAFQFIQVFSPAQLMQSLDKSGQAADADVRQHLIGMCYHRFLNRFCARKQTGDIFLGIGHDAVDRVYQLGVGRAFFASLRQGQPRQFDANAARIGAKDQQAICHADGLVDIVCDHQDGAGRNLLLVPEIEQFMAQVLGNQHVQRGEGFIQKQHFWLDDQRAGKANPLLHSTRKFAWISGLKAIQTDQVNGLERAGAPLCCWQLCGQQAQFDILQHGQPGIERETLKDDSDLWIGAF